MIGPKFTERQRVLGRRLAKWSGFVVGTATGAGVTGVIGHRVFVVQANLGYKPVGSLAFFVLFMLGIFALAAPFALGKFFGTRLRTKLAGDLVYAASFVAAFVVLGVTMSASLYALQVFGVSDPFGVLVVFDVVTGATLGGILGFLGVERIVDRRNRRAGDAASGSAVVGTARDASGLPVDAKLGTDRDRAGRREGEGGEGPKRSR